MRINWVDNAKALGIIAIVLGHGPGLNELVRNFLYTFHVPLFFLLSGVLVKSTHLEIPFADYIRRNLRRLVVPYLFFWCLAFFLWAAFQVAGGKLIWQQPELVLQQIAGLLMGTSDGLLAVNGVLWFYSSLFVSSLVLFFVARLPTSNFLLALLVFAVLGALIQPLLGGRHLPWNIDLIPVVMLFYGGGFLMMRAGWVPKLTNSRWALVAFVAFVVTLIITWVNEKVDLSWQVFGHSYLLYLLGSFGGSLMAMALGQVIRPGRVARYLSDNSIIIFSIHFPMYFAFWGVGVYLLKLPRDFDQHSSMFAVGYALLAFALCVPVVWVIRRYFSWGLGTQVRTQN